MEISSNQSFYSSWKYLSWKKCFLNLYRVQSRIFKSILVGNTRMGFALQNVIFRSNSVFLIAIREVTQIDNLRRVSGCDGKVYLDFLERFELAQFLNNNLTNWKPDKIKKVSLMRKDGLFFNIRVLTISDRCWQTIVKYSLAPAHEALFSYRNFGFRLSNTVFELQNFLILNMTKQSFGLQKRVLLFDFSTCSVQLNFTYLLKKLFLPRQIKLGIFRFLKIGFLPEFASVSLFLNLSSILSNILLTEIDYLSNSFRMGNNILFFLKPLDNEANITCAVNSLLSIIGFNFSYKCKLLSPTVGFDFLDWHFSLSSDLNVICNPSFASYQNFLRRVKRIINNSNYGANIKSLKLFPIVRDWSFYNRFANPESLKYSLFFIKKRAFKIFNSESKQDQYSTKFLIDKCFNLNLSYDNPHLKTDSFSLGHISFWYNSSFSSHSLNLNKSKVLIYCIHCGSKVSFNSNFE